MKSYSTLCAEARSEDDTIKANGNSGGLFSVMSSGVTNMVQKVKLGGSLRLKKTDNTGITTAGTNSERRSFRYKPLSTNGESTSLLCVDDPTKPESTKVESSAFSFSKNGDYQRVDCPQQRLVAPPSGDTADNPCVTQCSSHVDEVSDSEWGDWSSHDNQSQTSKVIDNHETTNGRHSTANSGRSYQQFR